MAMAWITKVTNASTETFTIRQNDPTWIPVMLNRQYSRDEPIKVYGMTAKGSDTKKLDPTWTWWQGPPRFIDVIADVDEIYTFPLQYCVIPWKGFGRLLLIADRTQKRIT